MAGLVVEKSLSMDNVFVIAVILTSLGIPRAAQHRVLVWGILAAVVLRGLMIGLGAALVPASARELHVDGVVFRPLAGADVAAELYLAWRADNDNPALPVFNAMVERFLSQEQGGA